MQRFDQEVIVLGAGVAGLCVGHRLAEAGRIVAVLEARGRIGGRILTAHVPVPGSGRAIAVELGAEFVHGLPQETWTVVREAGFAMFELGGDHLRYPRGRSGDDDNVGAGVLQSMDTWSSAQPPGQDASFAQFLSSAGIGGAPAQRAVRYVEGFNAAESQRIGVAALIRQQQAEDAIQADRLFRLRDGYDQLPAYLCAGLQRAGDNCCSNTSSGAFSGSLGR